MNNVCPICNSTLNDDDIIDYLNAILGNYEVFFKDLKIKVCHICGFGFACPFITQNKLKEFYSNDYRSEKSIFYNAGKRNSKFNECYFSTRAISQLLLAKMFRDFKAGENFLDIGSGVGSLFFTAKRIFPQMQFTAVEPDNYSYNYLRNINVEVIPLYFGIEPIKTLEGRKFDFILMSHILEHYNANEVMAVLANIKNLLSRKGMFLCEVPYADLRKYATKRDNDAPHLSFFTPESLREAFIKSGLKIIFISNSGQKYEEWRNDHLNKDRKRVSNWQICYKKWECIIKSFLPVELRGFIKAFISPPKSVYRILNSEDFLYGEERVCIRILSSL